MLKIGCANIALFDLSPALRNRVNTNLGIFLQIANNTIASRGSRSDIQNFGINIIVDALARAARAGNAGTAAGTAYARILTIAIANTLLSARATVVSSSTANTPIRAATALWAATLTLAALSGGNADKS